MNTIIPFLLCLIVVLPSLAATAHQKSCDPPCCIMIGATGPGVDRVFRCTEYDKTCHTTCWKTCPTRQDKDGISQPGFKHYCYKTAFSMYGCSTAKFAVSAGQACFDYTELHCASAGVNPCQYCDEALAWENRSDCTSEVTYEEF